MLLEIKNNTVPHLKALTCSIECRAGHGHGSTFKKRYTVLKCTILLHKWPKRQFHVTVTVLICFQARFCSNSNNIGLYQKSTSNTSLTLLKVFLYFLVFHSDPFFRVSQFSFECFLAFPSVPQHSLLCSLYFHSIFQCSVALVNVSQRSLKLLSHL